MSTRTNLIRGKIARILGSREVVLNIGREQGVEPGMKFDILYRDGIEIHDPDSGDVLGSIDYSKARIRTTNVYDKVSVASTYQTESVNVGGALGPDVRKLFQPPQWETRVETLKTEPSSEQENTASDKADNYVAVGDPVVQDIEVPF